MNIVNLHDDIGTDIYAHHKLEPNRLNEYHYPKLKKGGITHSAIVCFFDGKQSWEEMQVCILYSEQAILNSPYFSFQQDADIQAFLCVEGMCGIQDDIESKMEWMYTHHVRIASLVWNEDNALACGAKSGNKPLTLLGRQAIKKMNDLSMLIDISHLCKEGIKEILSLSTQPIIATHSNAYTICPHIRNLSDEHLCQIANKGGIIGCVPVYYFVSSQTPKANITSFIHMIQYMKQKIGTQHLAFGFDFMDYASEEDEMIEGLSTIAFLPHLITRLQDYFTQEEVKALLANNALSFLQPYL